MDEDKAADKARFLDLSDKADRLERLHRQAVAFGLDGARDVFDGALTATLLDLAEIVERAAGGDA